jgi:hypothetical protein
MVAPLRQRKDFKEQDVQEDLTPKFQEFQNINNNSAKFNELIFFARIALFGISTVLVAFLLLVWDFSPFLAFLVASLAGLVVTTIISTLIKKLY